MALIVLLCFAIGSHGIEIRLLLVANNDLDVLIDVIIEAKRVVLDWPS